MSDFMHRPAAGIDATAPVRVAEDMMDLYRVTHLLVFDRRRLVGVVCACDLRDAPAQETVAKYMSSPPMVVLPTAPIEAAATMCEEARIGCLPVVAGARVVGIVTRGDLRRAGVLDVDATPCQCCGTTRHVRPDPETGMYKCTDCRHPEERPDEWADLGVGD